MNAKQPAIEFNNILSKWFCLSCYNWPFHTSICFIQRWKYSTIKYGNGPVGNGFRTKCSDRVDIAWALMQFLIRTLVQLVTFLSQTLRSLRIIDFLHSSTTRPKKKKKNRSATVSSKLLFCSISSVQFSHSVVSDSLRPHELQHARPPCSSPTPGVYSNSFPSSRWCHPAISSSAVPFSSCPQSLPASGTFPMSQFSSGGQNIGASGSASVLPMNIQDWFPLGLTGWISLQSMGLSRVFSNTTVQKHQCCVSRWIKNWN